MTPFTKRLHAAGLTIQDLAFVANISAERLQNAARGRTELTVDELARVNKAIAHKPIVYTIWRREVEKAVNGGVTISTGVDGVISVAAKAV